MESMTTIEKLAITGEKIDAIGETINLISLYNPRSFEDVGEQLGRIIVDYAKDLHEELCKIPDAWHGDPSLLSELTEIKNHIQNDFAGIDENLDSAIQGVCKIDNFLNNDLPKIHELKEYFANAGVHFLNLSKERSEKKASAKHDGQAEAQSAGFGNQAKKAA